MGLQIAGALSTYITDGQLPVGNLGTNGSLADIFALHGDHTAMPFANRALYHFDACNAMIGMVEKLTDAETCIKLMRESWPDLQVR